MAKPATQTFPLKLIWMLLGTYAVLFGGAFLFAVIRFLFNPHFFTPWLAVAVGIAMLVQMVAVVMAIRLLAREPRYREAMNIVFAVAGAVPMVYLVISAMVFGVRFHM